MVVKCLVGHNEPLKYGEEFLVCVIQKFNEKTGYTWTEVSNREKKRFEV